MSKITRLGIDLGKNTFHVCAMDRAGHVVMHRRFTRRGLERFMHEQAPCVVGMEACGGAHHWARTLRASGHDARLMSAQFVRAYVKSNRNDWRDAEALCEAVGRPTMRYVPVKTAERQGIQHLHRARSLAVGHRTALANQMRGFLFEYGLVVAQGIGTLLRRVVEFIEDADNTLPLRMRELLAREREELVRLDARVKRFDAELDAMAREDEACRRLQTIPGVGPKVASALVAAAGDAGEFGSGREFAAWIGLTPRQRSTGGSHGVGGHQQARGPLPACAADSRGASGAARGGPARGPAQPLGDVGARAPGGEHCGGGAGEPQRAHRMGAAQARAGLPRRAGLGAAMRGAVVGLGARIAPPAHRRA